MFFDTLTSSQLCMMNTIFFLFFRVAKFAWAYQVVAALFVQTWWLVGRIRLQRWFPFRVSKCLFNNKYIMFSKQTKRFWQFGFLESFNLWKDLVDFLIQRTTCFKKNHQCHLNLHSLHTVFTKSLYSLYTVFTRSLHSLYKSPNSKYEYKTGVILTFIDRYCNKNTNDLAQYFIVFYFNNQSL